MIDQGKSKDFYVWRCYLIQVGQYTEIALDWFNNRTLIWRAINNRIRSVAQRLKLFAPR